MMFSAIVYCTEPMALYQFIHGLLSTQSPRTIIQATVNTIQSGDTLDSTTKKYLNQFYHDLDNIFHFQFGKIFLAQSSLGHMQDIMAKDWPFFANFSDEIKQCLSGATCQVVTDLVQTLGKNSSQFR